MAARMAQISAAAVSSRPETPASDSEAGSQTSSKRRDVSIDQGLQLELDDVFKLMDFLEKEGLQVLSADMESKAAARLEQTAVKPPPKVDSEAGVLSRVRSNDPLLCPPKLDLSKSRWNFHHHAIIILLFQSMHVHRRRELCSASRCAALVTGPAGLLMTLGCMRHYAPTLSW
jgi:hypothetical protein